MDIFLVYIIEQYFLILDKGPYKKKSNRNVDVKKNIHLHINDSHGIIHRICKKEIFLEKKKCGM